MTSYVVFKALQEGRLKLTDEVTISEHAWRAEGSRTFVQVGHADPGRHPHQGHDRAVGERRHHRARRARRRHRGGVRADDERVRAAPRHEGQQLREQRRPARPQPLHHGARHGHARRRADPRVPAVLPAVQPARVPVEQHPPGQPQRRCSARTRRSTGSRPGTPTAPATAWRPPPCATACAWSRWSWARRARRRARMPRRHSSTTATPSSRRCASRPRTTRCSSRASTSRRPSSPPWACPTTCMPPWRAARARACTDSARLSHEPLLAPLAAGQHVGELTVADGSGQVIARVPLVALGRRAAGRAVDARRRRHRAVVSLTRSAHG